MQVVLQSNVKCSIQRDLFVFYPCDSKTQLILNRLRFFKKINDFRATMIQILSNFDIQQGKFH